MLVLSLTGFDPKPTLPTGELMSPQERAPNHDALSGCAGNKN
jgi:hypothetical protein